MRCGVHVFLISPLIMLIQWILGGCLVILLIGFAVASGYLCLITSSQQSRLSRLQLELDGLASSTTTNVSSRNIYLRGFTGSQGNNGKDGTGSSVIGGNQVTAITLGTTTTVGVVDNLVVDSLSFTSTGSDTEVPLDTHLNEIQTLTWSGALNATSTIHLHRIADQVTINISPPSTTSLIGDGTITSSTTIPSLFRPNIEQNIMDFPMFTGSSPIINSRIRITSDGVVTLWYGINEFVQSDLTAGWPYTYPISFTAAI